ncbi:hypothetical protein SLEP1_g10017 [Rubroshorea leprosula]|uniref:Zinc finger PMZ-type domain-containing protein n=1 Tax=Rubroshorea leprosula TaxID=152421 RepID=A0AAV5ICH0_9ROSI|nr:hypothetical protein SLEP1_g10017 [Rubroshorea leprosula]
MITDYVVRQGYDRVSIKDFYYMRPWMDMPDGVVSCNSDSAIREMNDIISYAGNVELYVDHDINIPEIVEGPLLLTGDVSKDEGDNSGSDVSVHGDEGNLGSEKSSDDVSVIDWETSSDDSAWSLGSDKTDDEQVSIANLAQEVRKRRRNATRSSRKKSKAAVQTATRNEQEDDHIEEPVVTQEQPSVQQQQQPIVTDDQATVQEANVTDAAGGGNKVRRGDPIDSTQQLPVSDDSGSSTDEEDRESDYADSDDPSAWKFHWNSDDEDDIFVQPDHVVSRNVCQTYYNPKWKVPYFDIGMRFKDAKQFRTAVCKYSIQKQAQLRKVKNECTRVRFRCQTGCKWELFASYDSRYECFVVKTYYGEHRCFKSYDNKLVTYKVVADLFKGRIYEAPFTKPAEIVKWCKTNIKVNITLDKAEKAKKHVMTQLEGSYVDEYKYLKSYTKILRDSHLENTVVVTAIETSSSDTRIFHRMYVCLHSLKQGWKDGCRRFFGVDGCFLKGILVESECLESWQWFFELLKTDLDLSTGAGVTVMSDEHQAILSTVELILPEAEHRHCARHIYCNWAKLGQRGDEIKICFWNCAKATFQDDFIEKLGDLFAKNMQGHDDLLGYPRKHWCKAFIQENCKCDSIDNNISETFNSWILGARCKAIIAMNDHIRDQLMLRIADKRLFAEKWPEGDDIAPRIRKKLEELKAESQGCGVQPNGVNEFEVNDGGDQHVVKFDDKTCTCRYWQLSGVPYPHALACIRYKRWRVEHYISDFYKKEKYLAAYAYPLQCIRKGTKAWKAVAEEELLPPPVRSMLGRPRRKRRRHKGEPQKMKKGKLRKLTGKGRKMTCKGVNKIKKQGGEGASTSGSKKKKARVPTTTWSFIGVDDAVASSMPARPTTTEGNEKA